MYFYISCEKYEDYIETESAYDVEISAEPWESVSVGTMFSAAGIIIDWSRIDYWEQVDSEGTWVAGGSEETDNISLYSGSTVRVYLFAQTYVPLIGVVDLYNPDQSTESIIYGPNAMTTSVVGTVSSVASMFGISLPDLNKYYLLQWVITLDGSSAYNGSRLSDSVDLSYDEFSQAKLSLNFYSYTEIQLVVNDKLKQSIILNIGSTLSVTRVMSQWLTIFQQSGLIVPTQYFNRFCAWDRAHGDYKPYNICYDLSDNASLVNAQQYRLYYTDVAKFQLTARVIYNGVTYSTGTIYRQGESMSIDNWLTEFKNFAGVITPADTCIDHADIGGVEYSKERLYTANSSVTMMLYIVDKISITATTYLNNTLVETSTKLIEPGVKSAYNWATNFRNNIVGYVDKLTYSSVDYDYNEPVEITENSTIAIYFKSNPVITVNLYNGGYLQRTGTTSTYNKTSRVTVSVVAQAALGTVVFGDNEFKSATLDGVTYTSWFEEITIDGTSTLNVYIGIKPAIYVGIYKDSTIVADGSIYLGTGTHHDYSGILNKFLLENGEVQLPSGTLSYASDNDGDHDLYDPITITGDDFIDFYYLPTEDITVNVYNNNTLVNTYTGNVPQYKKRMELWLSVFGSYLQAYYPTGSQFTHAVCNGTTYNIDDVFEHNYSQIINLYFNTVLTANVEFYVDGQLFTSSTHSSIAETKTIEDWLYEFDLNQPDDTYFNFAEIGGVNYALSANYLWTSATFKVYWLTCPTLQVDAYYNGQMFASVSGHIVPGNAGIDNWVKFITDNAENFTQPGDVEIDTIEYNGTTYSWPTFPSVYIGSNAVLTVTYVRKRPRVTITAHSNGTQWSSVTAVVAEGTLMTLQAWIDLFNYTIGGLNVPPPGTVFNRATVNGESAELTDNVYVVQDTAILLYYIDIPTTTVQITTYINDVLLDTGSGQYSTRTLTVQQWLNLLEVNVPTTGLFSHGFANGSQVNLSSSITNNTNQVITLYWYTSLRPSYTITYNSTSVTALVNKGSVSFSYCRVYLYDITAEQTVIDHVVNWAASLTESGLTAGHQYRINVGYCTDSQGSGNIWIGAKEFTAPQPSASPLYILHNGAWCTGDLSLIDSQWKNAIITIFSGGTWH